VLRRALLDRDGKRRGFLRREERLSVFDALTGALLRTIADPVPKTSWTRALPGLAIATLCGYDIAMKPVNVAELKNRLSHYLRLVRRGHAILVRDRDRVIARIEPAGAHGLPVDDADARLADLEARGVVRRGQGGITPERFTQRPRVKADVVGTLLREREDTR
jgi:antitoxin (DNA-binding transcriptional repressor) of toxin-antitoxin stability system